ncbi:hypothetical protein XaraCFBP7407_22630, partial [Xanthomonas arboricola pv. arracaciae]|uniref:hypothetical protein n=1 Tax=Xanthomonas arboricola TaxID=56448 RepID=UPI000D4B9055
STPRLAESEQIRLLGGIHAAKVPASGGDTAPSVGRWSRENLVLLWGAEKFEIASFKACLLLEFD